MLALYLLWTCRGLWRTGISGEAPPFLSALTSLCVTYLEQACKEMHLQHHLQQTSKVILAMPMKVLGGCFVSTDDLLVPLLGILQDPLQANAVPISSTAMWEDKTQPQIPLL